MKSIAIALAGIVAATSFTGCLVVPGRHGRPRVLHPPRPVVKPKPVIVKPRPVVVKPKPIVVKPHPVKVVRPPMPAKPRVIIPRRPSAVHVWVPGKYEWRGNKWVWKKGYWKAAPRGKAKGHFKK